MCVRDDWELMRGRSQKTQSATRCSVTMTTTQPLEVVTMTTTQPLEVITMTTTHPLEVMLP